MKNLTGLRIIIWMVLIPFISGCGASSHQKNTSNATSVIFETDIGNDVDDALALDMLYKYMDEGKINLLAVSSNKDNKYSTEFINIMNIWYGYPNIPIGRVVNGAECENDAINYAQVVCEMEVNGQPAFRRSIKDVNSLPEATRLYREILSKQADSSVVIISVGFSTNLGRLLDTPADEFSSLTGKELVAKKVKLLCTMAGCFNNTSLFEYNIAKDIAAAKKVFEEWPTRLVTSPFEVGMAIKYPASSIENDFKWAPIQPMVEAYKSYLKMPYDRPTWDLTSVLYSVEGPSYFNVSPAGKISITNNGRTEFNPDTKGNRYYLTVDSLQAEKIKQHFVALITKKPVHFNK